MRKNLITAQKLCQKRGIARRAAAIALAALMAVGGGDNRASGKCSC